MINLKMKKKKLLGRNPRIKAQVPVKFGKKNQKYRKNKVLIQIKVGQETLERIIKAITWTSVFQLLM